jgi:membrane protease YdiL (CAAX protease family)
MPCFIVLVLASSVMMTWLRLRSGSLWTAAVMHASHNLFIQAFFTPITAPRGAITPYAIDEFGFMVPLVMGAFAVAFWMRRSAARRQEELAALAT